MEGSNNKMKKAKRLFRKIMRKFANKFNVLTIIIGCFTLLFAVSYGFFKITTGNYQATEMYMGKLMYGIEVSKASNSTDLTITNSNKSVTVPNNYTGTIFVTITSINPVNSRYKLQYSIATPNSCTSSNCVVKVTDESGWESQGVLKKEVSGLNNQLQSKKIKVAVVNTSGASITVNFDASGGYIYNTNYNNIALISGHSALPNEKYVEENYNVYLKDIVRKDLDCPATATLTKCLYGGESIRNYVKYPSNAESANYRILGLYKEDGIEYVKMVPIDNVGNEVQSSAITDTLNTYKNTFNSDTNKLKFFATSTSTPTTLDSNVVSLITKEDYVNTGLDESYARGDGTHNYWVDSTTYDGDDSNCINNNNLLADCSGNAYIKPVIKLNTNAYINYGITINIGGIDYPPGTIQNPYVLSTDDLIITRMTKGTSANSQNIITSTPTSGSYTLTPTCTGGSVTWDNPTYSLSFTITNTPVICSLVFVGS